ncbi:Winged helix-turn-helix DNA-binding [Haloechinothrix alba]|uniref:Winged helix-turn-helix DNA-binding n=1 Tax=Haloechinothrix alba TaxID=664784 RepID=A0A238WNP2_9PSEU|nr:bifunctional DNA primase/polymerase [Haloechinothrix alba]SNR47874.1 Winged helix-turn-helix DNA-binding [Haloechinothrix alba]
MVTTYSSSAEAPPWEGDTADAESDAHECHLVDAALSYARRAWRLHPVDRKDAPWWPEWPRKATTRTDIIRRIWRGRRPPYIGIATGHRSGLVVVDVDPQHGGTVDHLPPTLTAASPSGGWHFYYAHPGPDHYIASLTSDQVRTGVDIRADGGYVMAPPAPGRFFLDVNEEPAPCPHWVLALAERPGPGHRSGKGTSGGSRQRGGTGAHAGYSATGTTDYGAQALAAELDRLSRAEVGTRNEQLNRSAYRIGQLVAAGHIARADAEHQLTDTARGIGLTDTEIKKTIRSGLEAGMRNPRDEPNDGKSQGDQSEAEPLELDDFLAEGLPDYDWTVPGLLERADRLIVTGTEGCGKSTLLRQIAVQCASGIHPFSDQRYEPLRVLIVDLENSRRQVHRAVAPLRKSAGSDYGGGMLLHVRPQGLDVLTGTDATWLGDAVDRAKPDVIITGPIYKLAGGDPLDERTARAATAVLDDLRVRYECAVILEAHTPYAGNGFKRAERPYGASLWSRWPEFGIYLDGQTGHLRHWRGPRDERAWPFVLKYGTTWPWEVESRSQEAVWAQIVEIVQAEGERLTHRALAERIGVSKSTVSRVIKDHRTEWEELAT